MGATAASSLRRMTRAVAVVTDSTACLPGDVVAARGVLVVPLHVVVAGKAYDDELGGGLSGGAVAEALRRGRAVTTSRPSPAAFLAAYEKAAVDGAEAVVSVHLPAEVSGTHESAMLAAREAPLTVEVIDARTLGLGLGFAVLAAVEAADAGAPAPQVAAAARDRAARTSAFFYVDTLEHLRRGGRIGAAAALLGGALAVKPLLHLDQGRIAPLEKVRTASRALARLVDLAVAAAGDAPVDLAVQHLDADKRAADVAGRLRERVPHARVVLIGEVGAVIGAHVGPGTVGIVVAPL